MGSSQSSHAYVENGRRFLRNAQQLDHAACNTQNGELYKEAMNNYHSAVECIKKALENEKDSKRREILQDNMELCLNRVELLKIWNPVGGKCGAPKLLEMKKLEKSKENDKSDGHDDNDGGGGGKKSSRAVVAESDGTTTSEDTKILRDDAVDGSAMYTLGVELGKKATEEDKIACAAADPELYDLAKRTYHTAVDYFRSALKYEKVPKAIANIEDKIQEYLDRADILGAWAAAKKQTKSAVSSAVAAVKASDSQGSGSRKKSEKIVATTAAARPQLKKEQRHVRLEPKKTDSVTSVRGSVRSKESSKSQKSADSKKANNPKTTSSTSKKRPSEPKDGNGSGGSSVRSKQPSANSKQSNTSNTSKKGSTSTKSVSKKGGVDGKKESSGTKKTSASKSKQTKPNSKATTTKSKETCKCGYKSKRREKSGAKK